MTNPHFGMLVALLQNGNLVQVDTPEDAYYLGTCDQINILASATSTKVPKVNNLRQCGWAWRSDSDVCVGRNFVGVSEYKDLVTHFMRAVQPVVRSIHIIDARTGDRLQTIFEYVVRDWDVIFADGSLLMGSVAAVQTAIEHYDCVVNCTTTMKRPSHITNDSCYLQLAWEDHENQDITSDLNSTLTTITKWITVENKRVLGFCEQGISRSGACVLALLLLFHSFDKAYNILLVKRPIAKPNPGFMKQLKMVKSQKK